MASGVRPEEKDRFMTATLGDDMDMTKFHDAVATVIEFIIDGEDVLAHCDKGKHRSGCLVCCVAAVVRCGSVIGIMEAYVEGQVFELEGTKALQNLWEASGLWNLLDTLKHDLEIKRFNEDIKDALRRSKHVQVSCRLQACNQPASSQSATHEQGGVQQRSGQPQSKRRPQPPLSQGARLEQH